MSRITRKFPGKSAAEIYQRVHLVMGEVAQAFSLDYRTDAAAWSGTVSRMGISGAYQVRDGEVAVDVKFPMLIPGPMRRKVEDDIQRRLDALFA